MEEKGKKNIAFKIFASLLIILILFFSKKENQERFIEALKLDSLVLSEVDIVNSILLNVNIEDIAYYDNYIISWKDNKLTRYTKEGNKEWEKEFNFTYPYAVFGKKGIYVYDRNLGDIYYLNSEGDTINRYRVEGKINSIKECLEYILVHVEEDKEEGIRILDDRGIIVSKISIAEASILNYSLNNQMNRYAYSILKLEDGSIKSGINVCSLEGEPIWTLQLEDEIIMYVTFVDEEKLVAMSDKGLYLIDEAEILWQKPISSPKDIYVEGESIYILYDTKLELISLEGDLKDSMAFSEEYNNFTFVNGYVAVYGEKNMLGIKNMKKTFKFEPEETIIKVIPANRNLIILYENKVDIVSFY